jgi:hypothetical protein
MFYIYFVLADSKNFRIFAPRNRGCLPLPRRLQRFAAQDYRPSTSMVRWVVIIYNFLFYSFYKMKGMGQIGIKSISTPLFLQSFFGCSSVILRWMTEE